MDARRRDCDGVEDADVVAKGQELRKKNGG